MHSSIKRFIITFYGFCITISRHLRELHELILVTANLMGILDPYNIEQEKNKEKILLLRQNIVSGLEQADYTYCVQKFYYLTHSPKKINT